MNSEKHSDKLWQKLKEAPKPKAIGEIGFFEIAELRPTQVFVGEHEVKNKLKKLNSFSSEKRHEYLMSRPVPVVIGPSDTHFIVDHHHLLKAILEYGKNKAIITIIAVEKKLSATEFWRKMVKNHWVYPFDINNHRLEHAADFERALPHSLAKLVDDPFRAVAGLVRERGGFEKKTGVYFIEFEWARFFEKEMKVNFAREEFDKVVDEGLKLARSDKARDLPGYIKSKN